MYLKPGKDILDEYLQTSKEELLNDFENDKWEITDVFRVCDRRIGKRRLRQLRDSVTNEKLLAVIDKRLNE